MMLVLTNNDIMTNEHIDIMTSRDPNKLKIASFRTKEGVWAEFCQKAEANGMTATDVLKAAMEQFIAGEYTPTMGKLLLHHDGRTDSILTRDEIIDIVNTAISTTSLHNNKHTDNVLTRDEAKELARVSIEVALELIKKSVSELETYTRSQLAAVREEFKVIGDRAVEIPVSIAKTSITTPANTNKPDNEAPSEKSPSSELQRVVTRLEKEPELKARVISGLGQGFKGAALGQWLADGGFLNSKGEKYEGGSLSKFRAAIEWVESKKV